MRKTTTTEFTKARQNWIRDEHRRWKHNVERAQLQREALEQDAKSFGMTKLLAELDQS